MYWSSRIVLLHSIHFFISSITPKKILHINHLEVHTIQTIDVDYKWIHNLQKPFVLILFWIESFSSLIRKIPLSHHLFAHHWPYQNSSGIRSVSCGDPDFLVKLDNSYTLCTFCSWAYFSALHHRCAINNTEYNFWWSSESFDRKKIQRNAIIFRWIKNNLSVFINIFCVHGEWIYNIYLIHS